MTPAELKPESFAAYPPEARGLAVSQLPLLRTIPLPLLPVLLRQIIDWDWRFPAERREVEGQLRALGAMSPGERGALLEAFARLPLPAEIAATDWVHDPQGYTEQLTAALWSTHATEGYRAAAEAYAAHMREAVPAEAPIAPRLCMVVVGQGATRAPMPLFRKLRPHGVLLDQVRPEGGLAVLLAEAERRARATPAPYAHWYVDGGEAVRFAALAAGLGGAPGRRMTGPEGSSGAAARAAHISAPDPASGLVRLSYAELAPARRLLLERAQEVMAAPSSGPEQLRTLFARLTPADLKAGAEEPASARGKEIAEDAVVERFALSLLTDGSGTQIYATTFAQWGARECLRRAQPETLLLRFAPRQRQQGMDELLRGAASAGPDPEGSLVDADMGAYYTWINLQRLPGAEAARFLVWWEGQGRALVIGPGLPKGTRSAQAMDMQGLLKLLG